MPPPIGTLVSLVLDSPSFGASEARVADAHGYLWKLATHDAAEHIAHPNYGYAHTYASLATGFQYGWYDCEVETPDDILPQVR